MTHPILTPSQLAAELVDVAQRCAPSLPKQAREVLLHAARVYRETGEPALALDCARAASEIKEATELPRSRPFCPPSIPLRNARERCPMCNGSGLMGHDRPCPHCDGVGFKDDPAPASADERFLAAAAPGTHYRCAGASGPEPEPGLGAGRVPSELLAPFAQGVADGLLGLPGPVGGRGRRT
jgi:hypothetical protein